MIGRYRPRLLSSKPCSSHPRLYLVIVRATPDHDEISSTAQPEAASSSTFVTCFSQIISIQLLVAYGGVQAWASLRDEVLGNPEIAMVVLAGDIIQLAFIIRVIRERLDVKERDVVNEISSTSPSSIAQGLTSAMASIASIALLQTLSPSPEASQAIATLIDGQNSLGEAALILSNVFVGPINEELVWRALLLQQLNKWTRNQTGSVLVSSLAFSAWHLDSANFLSLSVLGGWLGAVYLRAGLSASIIAHSTFNAFALANLELSL